MNILFNGNNQVPAQPQSIQIQNIFQFARSLNGQNPEMIVRNLINSGKMSQEDFQRLSQQAQQLQKMTGLR